MKTQLLALMTVLPLIVSAGCGSSLENEALKRAKEHFKLTELGGSYYVCKVGGPEKVAAASSRASKTVYELRNVHLEVLPYALSEADKLNGIEWGAWVRLSADAFRRYCPQPDFGSEPDKTWSQWISDAEAGRARAVCGVSVTKTRGEWAVSGESNVTFKQVEQSDLPR